MYHNGFRVCADLAAVAAPTGFKDVAGVDDQGGYQEFEIAGRDAVLNFGVGQYS